MVFTILIADQYNGVHKGCPTCEDRQGGLCRTHLKEGEKQRKDSLEYLFRDTLSALCVLVVLVCVYMLGTYFSFSKIHVYTFGLTIVGGFLFVTDMLFMSLKQHYRIEASGEILNNAMTQENEKKRNKYIFAQFLVICLAASILLLGKAFGVKDLSLIGYLFLILYPLVKLYDWIESSIWLNTFVTIVCIAVGTTAYVYKGVINTITLAQIYSFFYL